MKRKGTCWFNMYETYRGEIRICTFNVNLTRARMDLITGSSRRERNDLGIFVFKRLTLLRRSFLIGPLGKATMALRYAQKFPLQTRKIEAFVYEKR